MGGLKVAIIGAGRMGTLLASRIPRNTRKVIIAPRKERAQQVADEVGAVASDQLSAVRGCAMVFLAVPGSAVDQVVQEIAPHLEADALIVNLATDVMTAELAVTYPRLRFAGAKVLGHVREIQLGSSGVVVLDHVEGEDEQRLRALLEEIGPVTRDREEMVLAANTAIVEVLERARAELSDRLSQLGLDGELVRVVITAAGPGVLRALSEGDIGPFAQSVLARMHSGQTTAP